MRVLGPCPELSAADFGGTKPAFFPFVTARMQRASRGEIAMRISQRSSLLLSVIPMIALALVFGACSTNQSASKQIDDAAITAEVKTKLAADPEVAAHNIDVDTLNGVVTLSGIVDSAAERDEAAKLARNTDHVKRVANNLQIKT
jgi:osmotically-inducible protein OsmY